MATLSDAERGMLADWWESDWPDTAAGVLGTLAETVEAILTARLAKVEALADEWDERLRREHSVGEEWTDWHSRALRAALASDPTHTQNGTQA